MAHRGLSGFPTVFSPSRPFWVILLRTTSVVCHGQEKRLLIEYQVTTNSLKRPVEKIFGWKNVRKHDGDLIGKKQDKAGIGEERKSPIMLTTSSRLMQSMNG